MLLARKWELPLPHVAATVTVIGCACAVLIGARGSSLPAVAIACATFVLTLAVSAAVGLGRFYRDPERISPARDDVVVSPADGRVVYVREAEKGELPQATKSGKRYTVEELTRTRLHEDPVAVIGIALNFLDVHVNRSPIRGSIALATRFPGRFASLKRPEAVFENERATIVVRGDYGEVAVVLIASRLVRRIVTYVKPGQSVALGERIGAIRFGSQADVVIPLDPSLELCVSAGDRVRAGQTVLASWGSVVSAASTPLTADAVATRHRG